MSATLILIGVTTASALALLVHYVDTRLTIRRTVLRERIIPTPALQRERNSLLRAEHGNSFFLNMLPISSRSAERINRELEQAGWPIRVGEYQTLRLICTILAAFAAYILLVSLRVEVAWLRILVVGLLAFIGWRIPRVYLSRKRRKRLERIERLLPDALTSMSKSLRAGTGLLQALAYAAEETPAPLGPELQSALRDLQLGAEAEDAFGALSERVGSPDLEIAITAIVIQRTVGGNLSEILTNVTSTIRERALLQSEVRILTAQQRLSAILIALIPVGIAALFIAASTGIGEILFRTTAGQVSLAVGIGFELLGIWLVRRFAIVEV